LPTSNIWYAFAAQNILLETTSLPSHSTIHFISTIINWDIGNVLENRHLMKMENTSTFGHAVLPTNSGGS
jgi:hypothetical protein